MDIRTKLVLVLAGTVVVIAAGLGLHYHGTLQGAEVERNTWLAKEAKEKDQQIDLAFEHNKKLESIQRSNDKILKETSNDYQAKLSQERQAKLDAVAESRRLGGLRIPASACPVPSLVGNTEATGTNGTDGRSQGTIALPEQIEADLWATSLEADEVNTQLRSLQNWIKAQGMYGEIPAKAD